MPIFNLVCLPVSVFVTFVAFTDFKSCTKLISPNTWSTEAGEYRLTRGTRFVARRLDLVLITELLRISWCIWDAAGFHGGVFSSFSNAHGLLQV